MPESLLPTTAIHFQATVERLGRTGDGVIQYGGRFFYIPDTLPGERLHLRLQDDRIDLLKRDNDSPQRVTPPCILFGQCGGCAMQHMSPTALLTWKIALVEHALHAAGYTNLPPPQTFQTARHTRRRMDFALQRVKNGMILGLHARRGDPVDMTECTLLHPKLMALLPPLRKVLSTLGVLTGRGGLNINLLDSGPDLTLETSNPPSSSDRSKLAAFARNHHIPRITWRSVTTKAIETIVQWGPVFHYFGDIKISPPPAAFLQATPDAEKAIIHAIVNGLPSLNRKDRIHELYAGCGTLTFPLAHKGTIRAYEGQPDAIAALKAATHGTRVEGFQRDLTRQPLLPADLKDARAVVLDPPYNGAGRQMDMLAQSDVRDVVYVSCNPAALTKDLTPLHRMGFDVLEWTVVDQFLWSAETESVISLTRDAKRLKKSKSATLRK